MVRASGTIHGTALTCIENVRPGFPASPRRAEALSCVEDVDLEADTRLRM